MIERQGQPGPQGAKGPDDNPQRETDSSEVKQQRQIQCRFLPPPSLCGDRNHHPCCCSGTTSEQGGPNIK